MDATAAVAAAEGQLIAAAVQGISMFSQREPFSNQS